ncbi:MAG: SAM-dependent methyltransferase [Hyphomicrobiales bacterium]|nr:MAG: SAM-dependent methyltransferase [Hyphomicrobiales bacterium]
MTPDVKRLIGFYKSPLGKIARALVREQVIRMAGPIDRRRVLGLGFASPYLRFALEKAERVLAFMPARQGASAWPREGPSHTVLCDPLEMPLTDAAVDLIIAVHAFEHVSDAEELMRELWRVAAPNARLIVVVPRRRGMWAAADNQPFGDGNPFSRTQVERLLRDHSFVPESWREVLYLPPSNRRVFLRLARLFERFGPLFGPLFAGVIVVSAKKELFPAVPRRRKLERYVRVPSLAPQTAMEANDGKALRS